MSSTLASERQTLIEELYKEYARDVYRYALAVLRNPADAEDVTQTTFMNACRAIKRGDRPVKPQHWLITIAHNACRTSAIRASRRPREVPLDERRVDIPVSGAEAPNLPALLEALGELPFNQRSALVMRELEGRSYEEIAETLGVTVPAVETLIFRARRSLRPRHEAIRGLAVIQLPVSLQSFGASLATTGGGTVLGGGIALKAVALVTALVAGTATYEAVQPAQSARRTGQTTVATALVARMTTPARGKPAAPAHTAPVRPAAFVAGANATGADASPTTAATSSGSAAPDSHVATQAAARAAGTVASPTAAKLARVRDQLDSGLSQRLRPLQPVASLLGDAAQLPLVDSVAASVPVALPTPSLIPPGPAQPLASAVGVPVTTVEVPPLP